MKTLVWKYQSEYFWAFIGEYIYETEISPICQLLQDFPRYITVSDAPDFFSKKKKSCPGNNDFSEVIKNRLLHGMDLNFYDDEKM